MGWWEDFFGGGEKPAPRQHTPTVRERTRELSMPQGRGGFGTSRGAPMTQEESPRPWNPQPAPEPDKRRSYYQSPVDRAGQLETPWSTRAVTDTVTGMTEEAREEQAAAQKRATERAVTKNSLTDALGGTADGKATTLGWDEYSALNPAQRAAVDANTLLSKAIEKDVAAGKFATGNADEEYMASVEALFGQGAGSARYAPETIKTLQLLGMSGEGNDLDNYLNQTALLTKEDLSLIGGAAPDEDIRGQNVLQFSDQAVKGIAGQLAQGNNLLSGIRAEDVRQTELNDLFNVLSSRRNYNQFGEGGADSIFGQFLAENPDIDEATMTRYFEDRLNAFDYGAAAGLTGEPNPAYISPAEFRRRYYTKG
jgi:hypothetical protein